MNENLAKNRSVLIDPEDYKDLEFMLWMYDLRAIDTFPSLRYKGFMWVMFRCSDVKYSKLYEKMDSLGIWKGDAINPRVSGSGVGIECDEINICDVQYSKDRYLVIGV